MENLIITKKIKNNETFYGFWIDQKIIFLIIEYDKHMKFIEYISFKSFNPNVPIHWQKLSYIEKKQLQNNKIDLYKFIFSNDTNILFFNKTKHITYIGKIKKCMEIYNKLKEHFQNIIKGK